MATNIRTWNKGSKKMILWKEQGDYGCRADRHYTIKRHWRKDSEAFLQIKYKDCRGTASELSERL